MVDPSCSGGITRSDANVGSAMGMPMAKVAFSADFRRRPGSRHAISGDRLKIAYFVHDTADAAVHRRVRMMRCFADVTLLGFRRSDGAARAFDCVDTIDLGRTVDARLGHRAIAVLRAAASSGRWRRRLGVSTIFIARQLEMLAVAAFARRLAAPDAPMVFECLDIHRLMSTNQVIGRALRMLERRLLRSCALLIVSSPAFLTNHFIRYEPELPPQLLLENKVLAADIPSGALDPGERPRTRARTSGSPWRIGWFGVIRCRRGLDILADLVRRLPGVVEVVIRGRPRRNIIPEFDTVVQTTPGLSFLGEYDRHTQLAAIYGDVHFAWTLDFFEAGQNSKWLLPNRLYEASLYGAVPLAQNGVETGNWLRDRECGVRLEDTPEHRLEQSLFEFFRGLDAAGYQAAQYALSKVKVSDFLDDQSACDRFGAVLQTLSRRNRT